MKFAFLGKETAWNVRRQYQIAFRLKTCGCAAIGSSTGTGDWDRASQAGRFVDDLRFIINDLGGAWLGR